MEENNVELRNATAEETEALISWASKQCSQTRKGTLFLLAFFFIPYIFLTIVCVIYFFSPIVIGIIIFLIVYLLIFCGVLYFYFAPSIIRKIESGAYKVQSGKIIDRNEEENTPGNKDCTVIFESDNGNRASININPKLYHTVKTGPCLILKWDDLKNQKYYRVIM